MRVFLTGRDEKALQRTARDISATGAYVDFAAADLGDNVQIEAMFESAIKFLGGIEVLVNNAGTNIKKTAMDLCVEEWERILAVNLRAAFILSKLAAGQMAQLGEGQIINIGSGASQTPMAEHTAYCASKYGLLGFSESLGLELRGRGIKVSIVLPGSTATYFGGSGPEAKMASMPGMLMPEDVADCVIFLLRQQPGAWTSVMNLRPLNSKRP